MSRVSATILNWNEWEVALPSVVRLLVDPLVTEVIVVDNASVDESYTAFSSIDNPKFKYLRLDNNYGCSVGKNRGISLCNPSSEYIFLLNGDMKYVPGTIEAYSTILDTYPECATVGYHDWYIQQALYKYGLHVESISPFMSHAFVGTDGYLEEGFPTVIPCYGLFRHEVLKQYPFVEEGPFGNHGGGYEDDWMWREFTAAGWDCLTYSRPFVYHNRELSTRFLNNKEIHEIRNEQARAELFRERWGNSSSYLLDNNMVLRKFVPLPW